MCFFPQSNGSSFTTVGKEDRWFWQVIHSTETYEFPVCILRVPTCLISEKNLLLGEERKWGLIKKILLDFSDRRWLSQTTLWQVKCKWIRTYGLNFLSSIRGFVNNEKKGMKKCSLILPNPRHLNNCSRKYAKATFFSLKPTYYQKKHWTCAIISVWWITQGSLEFSHDSLRVIFQKKNWICVIIGKVKKYVLCK